MYVSPFTLYGKTYTCVEQYYLEQKALFLGQTLMAALILQLDGPRAMKSLLKASERRLKKNPSGRALLGQWCYQQVGVMERAVFEKFNQNPNLKEFLVGTLGQVIVEANRYDLFWGVGLSVSNPLIHNPTNWRGENEMGNTLMRVRDRLASGNEASGSGLPSQQYY